MTTFAQLDSARTRHRAIAWRALLAIAVLVPTAVLFMQAWGNEQRSLDAATTERHGVAYVRALEQTIVSVVVAESAAVAGDTPDLRPVDRAALAVTSVDESYGAALRTQTIWANVDNRIQQLHTRTQLAPADALAAYEDITDQLLSLTDKVRASSGLDGDAHPESVALQAAVTADLPEAIVMSGRYADQLVLGSGGSGADLRAAVQRDAADVAVDVQNASAASPDAAISDQTLSAADRFGLDAAALIAIGAAPSTGSSSTDAADAVAAATAVRASADALATSILRTMDDLLSARITDTQRSRDMTIGIAALAVLIACVPMTIAAIRRRDLPLTDLTPTDAKGPGATRVAHGPEPRAAGLAYASDLGRAVTGADTRVDIGAPAGGRHGAGAPPSLTALPHGGQQRFDEGEPLPRRRQQIMPPPAAVMPPQFGAASAPAGASEPSTAPDHAAPASAGGPAAGGPATAGGPAAAEHRELLPAGVTHHRRPSSSSETRSGNGEAASDDWGRNGVAK